MFLVRRVGVCQRQAMRTRSLAALPLVLLLACSEQEPSGDLTIIALGQQAHTASLQCPPDGTHPDPETACAALEEAGGDFDALEPLDLVCPAVNEPVWAAVTGVWQGERIEWAQQFPNLCQAKSVTSGVIDFV